MAQATKPRFNKVTVLIAFIVLILLAGGLGYYYFLVRKPLPTYSVTVDPNKADRLIPRPKRGRRSYPGLNFYFTGDAIDVSQYQQVKILNPEKIKLKLLQELDARGLIITTGRQKQQMEYNELPLSEEKPGIQVIEVGKLERGKRYVLCEWPPRHPRLLKYFFAFTRQ
jgi:hypothetical protein